MNYTLHQLHIFLKISHNQSITRTAEELFLTQPAVSIQLKNFQNQFSIPLTEVVGRQLYVTEFGLEIAAAAQKIINEVESINYKTLAYKGELSGKLRISVASTGKYVMPYFLSGFIKQHKGVELIMDVTNKSKVVRSMERNEVDFALVSVLPKKLNIHHVELMKNQLFLVGNNDRKFGGKSIKKDEFENLPFIYREDGSATRDAMETYITKNKYPVRKKIQLTSNEAVKQAVVAGLGYSIMPLIGIKNEIQNKDLQIIQTQGLPLSTQWCIIWLKAKNLSPTAEAYLKFLNTTKELIINESFGWIKEYQKA